MNDAWHEMLERARQDEARRAVSDSARAQERVARYAQEQHRENQQLRLLTAVLSIAVIVDLLIVAQTSDLGFWRIIGTAFVALALYLVLRVIPPRVDQFRSARRRKKALKIQERRAADTATE